MAEVLVEADVNGIECVWNVISLIKDCNQEGIMKAGH